MALGRNGAVQGDLNGTPEPAVECEVLVIGSGAGGLSAAVTARKAGLDVCVIEKDAQFGGTTARSGGVLWVPANPVSARAGVRDTIEAARTYLRHETGNFFDAARIDAFLANASSMVEFFEAETCVKFVSSTSFPDYHPDAPGGLSGGRSIVAAPMDGRTLGSHLRDLRPPLREITFVGMMFNASQEVQHFFKATRSVTSAVYVANRLVSHAREMLTHGRATRLTNGNALVARLAASAFGLGIPVRLSTPARELIVSEHGKVEGAIVDSPHGPLRIHASRGVVLACGGFPQDLDRRKQLFPHAPTGAEHFSPAPAGNTGDGLRMARSVGGVTEDSLPNAAAWIPVSRVPYRNGSLGVFPHLIDRYKPGLIAVLRNGRRFVNEAHSYHDFGQALIASCPPGDDVTAWLVCDHRALRRYGMGFVKPFPIPFSSHIASRYLLRGRTIRQLAETAGIDPDGLERTITSFNRYAVDGSDPEFGKGSTAYNRYLGDHEHRPNPCVASLDQAPYYAIKLYLGDLGTFGGLKTDAQGRVLKSDGAAIEGLYAVGNDMASIMGGNYPGGGITLGPAMTFGFIIGRALAAPMERSTGSTV